MVFLLLIGKGGLSASQECQWRRCFETMSSLCRDRVEPILALRRDQLRRATKYSTNAVEILLARLPEPW
jgi:hypothetical protein